VTNNDDVTNDDLVTNDDVVTNDDDVTQPRRDSCGGIDDEEETKQRCDEATE